MPIDQTDLRCPACGSTSRTLVLTKENDGRRPGAISLHRCSACDTIYLGVGAADGYDDDLYAYYAQRAEWPRERLYPVLNDIRSGELLRWFARELDARGGGRRILDVGCGMGQFVNAATRAQWNVQGIELAAGAVAIARRFGLPVRRLDLFSGDLVPESFDVATMFEVIEHLPRPGAFLRRVESLLRPGGLMYLTTPNFACADRRILGSEWDAIHREHLVYFTPQTLSALVRRASSLRVVHVETRNISAAALRALFAGHPSPTDTPGEGSASEPASRGQRRTSEQRLRALSEGSLLARTSKRLANRALNRFDLGNSLVMLLERPR